MGDILFLAHRIPYPPDRGDKIRSFHLVEHLSRLGRVHLGAFVDTPDELDHAEALKRMIGGTLHLEPRQRSRGSAALAALAARAPISVVAFASRTMRSFVARTLDHQPIETIFAFSGQMAQFVPRQRNGARFVMDFVDVDSAKFGAYAQQSHGLMRAVQRREAAKLSAYEAAVARGADASLFVTEAEAALFRQRSGAPNAVALENGVDLDRFQPMPRQGEGAPLIVFTGQMDYLPNVRAAARFARETMPLIRRRHGEARFAIVGRKPVPALLALDGRNGVIVTGEVADTRRWIADSDVVVAPLALARGIQNKVLEAMAMARPVVASSAAFEGIDAVRGRDLIVADGPEMEAAAVIGLIDDPERAWAIGAAARARMELRYDWNATLAPLADLVRGP